MRRDVTRLIGDTTAYLVSILTMLTIITREEPTIATAFVAAAAVSLTAGLGILFVANMQTRLPKPST